MKTQQSGEVTICSCGKVHVQEDGDCIVKKGAIRLLPDYVKKLNAQKVFVLADINTYPVAGEKVCRVLEEHGIAYTKYIFTEKALEPDEKAVGSAVMHFDVTCNLVVGVGSGVINDISKILSNLAQTPYIIVATAPSMDGYASATSSMTMDGIKVSLPSKCADVILGDLDVLCEAPLKMMISGLGDMLAKYVSICEWRLSHLITGEYYCEEIADMVRAALKRCVDNAEGLLKRDEEAVAAVFDGLVFCGRAMKCAGLSRPASGIEHYFSHVWDMRGAEFGTPVELHGIQCAVGTLLAVKLYEKLASMTPDRENALKYAGNFDFDAWSETLRVFIGKGAENMIALEEKEQKYNVKQHGVRLEHILNHWEEILQIIKEELPSSVELELLFDKLGAPKTMREIGIEEEIFELTFKATKDIRDKYVLSRLCWDLGVLDELAVLD